MNYDGLGWWILSTLDVCFWCTMSFPWLILHVLNLSGWMIISINMLSEAPKSYLIVCLFPIWWMQRAALLHDKSRWHHRERDGYGGAGESKLTQVSDHHYRYIACNEFCDWITATIGAAKQPNLFTSSHTKTHLKPSVLFSPPLLFTNRLSSMSLPPPTHNPQINCRMEREIKGDIMMVSGAVGPVYSTIHLPIPTVILLAVKAWGLLEETQVMHYIVKKSYLTPLI